MPTELEQAVGEFEENAKLQTGMETKPEADRAARILNIGSRTGIPYDIVDSSLEELEIETAKADFDYEKWRKHSPKFAEFASENPYHLSVLEADEENLTMLERAWRPVEMGWDKTWADVELMQIGERRAKGREYWQEDDEERMTELRKLSEQTHDFGAENWPHKWVVWTAKNLGPTLHTMGEGLDELMIGAMAGAGTGAIVGTTAGPGGTAAGALAGWTTGASVGFGTGIAESSAGLMTGEAYNNYIAQGFSHENASIMAKGVGLIGGAAEVVPVYKFLKYIPGVGRITNTMGKTVAERLGKDVLEKRSMAQATKTLALRYGEVMGTEIGVEIFQESVQTVGNNILAEMEGKPQAQVSWDEYVDQVAEVAVETAKAVILIAGIGPGMQFVGDVRRAGKAERTKSVWETIGRGAKASKTAAKAPETFRAFVSRFAEAGKVLIDADRWDVYWQDQGADPTQMAQELGVDVQDLNEARTTGGSLEISGTEFINKIAPTKHHDGLLPDLKADPDDMSLRDAELFRKNNPEIMKALEESVANIAQSEYEAAGDRIVQDVFGQLVAAGQAGPEHLAELHRGIANIAERAGLDPDELYQQVFGGVTRVADPALGRRDDVDLSLDPYLNMLREGKQPTQRQMFGPTLVDFIKKKGGLLDEGGELSARDLGKEFPGLVRPQAGQSLDAMAEAAAEAGYLPPDYSPNDLLAALDRERTGQPVRSRYETGDPRLQELGTMLEELEERLGMMGLDVDTMTNQEIRYKLEQMERYNQLTTEELVELLGALDSAQGQVEEADKVNNALAEAATLLSVLEQTADFGNTEITDTVRVRETGEIAEMTAPAESIFKRAKQRKENAVKLLDCLK